MAHVFVKGDDRSVEKALRKLKRLLDREGVLREFRERRYRIKPSEKKRKKSKEAKKRKKRQKIMYKP